MKGITTILFMFCVGVALAAPPESETSSRNAVRDIHQMIDKENPTFYCKCPIDPDNDVPVFASCGYEKPESFKGQPKGWDKEHIVPASELGKHLPCWKDAPEDSRTYCRKVDPVFKAMYFNLHNLVPVVDQVNKSRSNYSFTVFDQNSDCKKEIRNYGACEIKISNECNLVEPPTHTRGAIARIYLYMWKKYEKYGFKLDMEQQEMFEDWNKNHPVTEWECARDRLIAQAKYQGKHNPKVQEKCSEEGL